VAETHSFPRRCHRSPSSTVAPRRSTACLRSASPCGLASSATRCASASARLASRGLSEHFASHHKKSTSEGNRSSHIGPTLSRYVSHFSEGRHTSPQGITPPTGTTQPTGAPHLPYRRHIIGKSTSLVDIPGTEIAFGHQHVSAANFTAWDSDSTVLAANLAPRALTSGSNESFVLCWRRDFALAHWTA